MIELPEALTLADQLNKTIARKRVVKVTAGHTPHKLAWYYGDPDKYSSLLVGKTIDEAVGYGALVEIKAETSAILFGDGVSLRFHDRNNSLPAKHQFLVEFDDFSAISACIQMYGGVGCVGEGTLDNRYYKVAKEKPSPLGDGFSTEYFDRLVSAPEVQKLSAKALLATEQRIPGIGNGVLQDILFKAGVHPKKRILAFSGNDKKAMFDSIKTVLLDMSDRGGRDTETDLFGNPGSFLPATARPAPRRTPEQPPQTRNQKPKTNQKPGVHPKHSDW